MTQQLEPGWGEWWPAPAKLNLLLRIVGRRTDGYHNLQTVFQFIDRADRISFYPRMDRAIRLRKCLPGVAESDDLTVRAAQLLWRSGDLRNGVDIEVDKNLPMGGGLGGGSSDAATVLVVLNKLWKLDYSDRELMDMGRRLGADVPIFVSGRSAWAEGVGDVLQDINPPENWYVVVVPDCEVSTMRIFCDEQLTRDNRPVTIRDFTSGFSCNDCLSAVTRLYPQVGEALGTLAEYGDARLTGTGACVFLACEDRTTAEEIAFELKDQYQVFVTEGKNRSPLRSKIDALFG